MLNGMVLREMSAVGPSERAKVSPTSISRTSPGAHETSARVSLMISTADSRYSVGMSDPSPYWNGYQYSFSQGTKLQSELTYKCRGLVLSILVYVRRLKGFGIGSIEKPRHYIVEEGRLASSGMISHR